VASLAPGKPYDGPLIGGRWRIGPRLGHGAQGETYLARSADAGDDVVVVKRLVPRGTWKSFDLFEREAKVLSQLRHPGVPKFIATVEDPPGTFNLVMQRMPGDNLRDLVERRRLSELELIDVLARTLEILDYLHGRVPAVVHRDIKPSNLVRAPDGSIALVDFGGVLDAAREKGGSTIVGTFGYMAPEQLHGQAVAATDLYALGATIVALAGGVEPEDVPRKGLRMDLDKHLPGLDPGLRAALAAMTDPDPDKRPQRARDVIKLLGGAKQKASAKAEAKALAVREERVPARHRSSARKLFPDVPEPLGTLFRLTVLAFGASGWLAMLGIRFWLWWMTFLGVIFLFPIRKKIRGVGKELDLMLEEGQSGFADISRRAMGRRTPRPALPPGES
jgi:serine/threonine protein kinase